MPSTWFTGAGVERTHFMRILLTGAGGLLGRALQKELPKAGFSLTALTHAALDVTDPEDTAAALDEHHPDVVINCAAYTRVDDAEQHESEAAAINTHAARALALLCKARDLRIVYPSTDYVFPGDQVQPYSPEDPPRPLNAYGRTKLGGEEGTRVAPDHLIIRTSWLYGRGGPNFVRTIMARLKDSEQLRVVNDQVGRPTSAQDLAAGIARLLRFDTTPGTYHIANQGSASWFEFAQAIARLAGRPEGIVACASSDFPRAAQRPAWSVLSTTKADRLIGPLRHWHKALAEALQREDY